MKKPILYIIIFFLCREIYKYEPDEYKSRFYYSLKRSGLITEHISLNEFDSDSTFIILAAGQSNAGYSSNYYYIPKNNVLTYVNGRLFRNEQLYASGSVWEMLADKLIDSGYCRKVIIIPIAAGKTDIDNWASGPCSLILKNTLMDLQAKGIKLTHICWHHGESGNGNNPSPYKTNLKIMFNEIRLSQSAPFYCSVASFNPYSYPTIDLKIDNIQREFITENAGVLIGPYTDSLINSSQRFDGQHFSKYGLECYAQLWFNALKI